MYKLTIRLLLLITLNLPLYANSQEQSSSSSETVTGAGVNENPYIDQSLSALMDVDIYTTTASKIKESIDKSIATVTVIDQEQIR